MNTRKYPRSLNEAFPHTADYACSVERPMFARDRVASWAVGLMLVVAVVVLWSVA